MTLSLPVIAPVSPAKEASRSPVGVAEEPNTAVANSTKPAASSSSATFASSNNNALAGPLSVTTKTAPEPLSGSSRFLTSLAAQERRVLELREDLEKAEADLWHQKKQWARYEASRKRDAMRQLEPLQSLQSPHSSTSPVGNLTFQSAPTTTGSSFSPTFLLSPSTTPSAGFPDSMEKFRATDATWKNSSESGRHQPYPHHLRHTHPNQPVVRKSTQRVFSGSRHTRALSLLSPEATRSTSPPQSTHSEPALSPMVTTTEAHSERQFPLPKDVHAAGSSAKLRFSKTYRQIAQNKAGSTPQLSISPSEQARDATVTGGKRVAADFREGLWTFFEDIRQATVSEEGISASETQTSRSRRPEPSQVQQTRQFQQHNENMLDSIGEASVIGAASRKERQSTRDSSETRRVGLNDYAIASLLASLHI